MPDIASISAVFTSLRTATEMARLIKEAGPSLADAERKMKFAELINSLADAKISLAELKEEVEERDSEIRRLRDALSVKPTLKHSGVFYFADGDSAPFCPRCWEKDSLSIHVGPEEWVGDRFHYVRMCPQCKSAYKTRDGEIHVG